MKRRYGIVDSRPFRDPNLSQGTQSHLPELLCTRKERLHILYSFDGGLPLKLLEWYCFWFTLLERRLFINVSITVLTFQKSGSSCRNKVPTTNSVTELEYAHREWLWAEDNTGSRHHCAYWSQWGILEVKGKMDFWSSPPLNGPSENTHYGYFLSGSGKIELSCKLIGLEGFYLPGNSSKPYSLSRELEHHVQIWYRLSTKPKEILCSL